MKLILILIISSFGCTLISHAQTSTWKLYLNKKQVAQGTVTQRSDSTIIVLKKSRLSRSKLLRIDYMESVVPKGWNRSFAFYDGDKEIAHFKFGSSSGMFGIPLKQTQLLKAGGKIISLYTYSEPLDEKLASAIRIRRILICRLKIE